MRIAIVGAGRIGGSAARLWSRAGHDVVICLSRHPDQLAASASELGDHVSAASPAEAVATAEVVMLAVPWGAIDPALAELGSLAGSVVVDATNPYGPGPQPVPGQTVAEFNSARMPGARYVRGFNTLTAGFHAQAANHSGGQRAVLFSCGGYPAAKDIVARLIDDAGFAAVDLGSAAHAAVVEAPRRPGSVYGEEYRVPEAQALRQGHAIPPTPLPTPPRHHHDGRQPANPFCERRQAHTRRGGRSVTHKNVNPSAPAHPKRVAIVLSNPAVSSTTGWPVGFWWAELTHPYFRFTEVGYDVELFSPFGGRCEADAMSDPEDASQWQAEDVISRGYKHDPVFLKLIETTRPVDEIDQDRFDAIVVAGGQGPMFTFEAAANLHTKFTEFYEAGRLCAALCHGVAVLRYARLSNGESLVAGKTVTGFANVEEDFNDRFVWDTGALPPDRHVMPWRIEDELKTLGANFIQAGPWKGFAIRDGNLITGQQNFSGGDTADLIIETLGR